MEEQGTAGEEKNQEGPTFICNTSMDLREEEYTAYMSLLVTILYPV